MGKRSRRRARGAGAQAPAEIAGASAEAGEGALGAASRLAAPTSDYRDAHGNTLTLRGSFPPAARRDYADLLAGKGARAASTQEDAWQRAVEFLFERLAVRWDIAGAPIERQRELLARLRAASPEERKWVRESLREHCAENFPDVQAP